MTTIYEALGESDSPDLLTPTAPASIPTAESSPQRNVLKFNERTKLSLWLNTDDMRARAAKDSDATLAADAAQTLGFDVTAANITSMRANLGIAKAKPEKPAPADPGEVDLITLQQKITAQGLEIEHLKVSANGTEALLDTLRAHIHHIEHVLLHNGNVGNITYLGLPTPARIEGLNEYPLAATSTPLPPFNVQR